MNDVAQPPRFSIGQKVFIVEPNAASYPGSPKKVKIFGEVVNITDKYVFVKWEDINDPIGHCYTGDIKIVRNEQTT